MSDADKAEVIQGRLGWEPGDVSEANPEGLEPHPKNREIYGDTDDVSDLDNVFKQSVAQNGVLEPLVITHGKEIVSGHRRWLAAKAADLDTVPVRYTEFESELAEREALVEFNRQREKTPAQIVNEFEEILAIEKERSRERQGNRTDLKKDKHRGNVSTKSDSGKARDKAAEKVNADVSGRTLEKGKTVKDKAQSDDEPEEVREVAQEQWDKLQDGKSSFHTAAKEVEKAEAEVEVANQEGDGQKYTPKVRHGEATALLREVDDPELVIADPPYSTDIDSIESFVSNWLPGLVDTIGSDGRAFVFIGAYPQEVQTYLSVLTECGAIDRCQMVIWTYRNTLGQTPNDQYKLNYQVVLFLQSDPATELDSPKTSEQWAVQDINAPDARHGERHHEWEKPGKLIERFIRHTTNEGDLVVDPFVGTGTTVLKATDLGRKAVGCDINEDMLDIAISRGCERDE